MVYVMCSLTLLPVELCAHMILKSVVGLFLEYGDAKALALPKTGFIYDNPSGSGELLSSETREAPLLLSQKRCVCHLLGFVKAQGAF